jgi:HlyD family secretion protein
MTNNTWRSGPHRNDLRDWPSRWSRILGTLLTFSLPFLAAGCDALQESDRGVDASGFIEARSYSLASELGGTVSEISVEVGDEVEAEEILLSLDISGLENTRTQAEAGVAAAEAALQGLQDQPSEVDQIQAQAALDEAQGKQDAAEAELALLLASYAPANPPTADLHLAEAKVEISKAEVQFVLAQFNQVAAGARSGEIDAAEAVLAGAEANLELILLQIEMMRLASPIAGVVGEVLVHPGETASPGAPLIVVHELSELRLTVYVAETHVARLNTGDQATIMVDAYPDDTWTGRIVRIADQAQFTPSNVQTVEERVKLVFAVEIAVDDASGRLKPGMPADVIFED